MKIIEVDEELYQYIAANTRSIGESASDILRRLLKLSSSQSGNKEQIVATDGMALSSQESAKTVDQVVQTNAVQINAGEPVKSAVQPTVDVVEPVIPRKQSDEAIQRVVNRLNSVLQSEEFQSESKGVVRFLMILTALYRANPESFAQATESQQGRTRIYFARDEATLLQAGNHTKPRQIPETPYWVITNTNSQRKMSMLEGAMTSMHLPTELVEEVRSYFSV
ncbi:replication initiation negative regulator SeqA [Pasteurellaceae bacterium USgator11]|nr:replication initiation negative regulator SeqA [Pasteurellaceae bacterium UScroc12]TNG97475.1 replication initiation negative regulator SeqA [Pasteurellaceae bacterium UScroc31]TNG98348.1 replication initiation negative regulator SeqA [Pasteurellaceae bacterium USgator41]TNH02756.1 replication initiation negative regulator SeqA [Pasteurellaceae bacterium USgator11]